MTNSQKTILTETMNDSLIDVTHQVLLDSLPCIALILRPVTHEIVIANNAAINLGVIQKGSGNTTSCYWRLEPGDWINKVEEQEEFESNGHIWDAHWIPLQNEYYLFYAHDITTIKKTEEEHQKCLNIESLGHLAGSIAHDFNNLLGGIYGFIDLAGAKTEDERVVKYLSKALCTMERAKSLTRQLLTFAKGGAPVKRPFALFPLLLERARTTLKNSPITLNFIEKKGLWLCECDCSQITIMIDNLIMNARDAMSDEGVLTIDLSNYREKFGEQNDPNRDHYIRILIEDTGPGIPESILPHVFDPFYTTKPKARGLGLAICYSIVNRHNGYINVDSKMGKGCTFTVFLPAVPTTEAPGATPIVPSTPKKGTIIVVDDEEILRETIGDQLRSAGYTVVSKSDGHDALDFFVVELQTGGNVAGMIFDLTIPDGAGGKEVIDDIRKLAPSIPVLVASGYTDDPVMSDPQKYGFTASIAKPFRKDELLAALEKHLP